MIAAVRRAASIACFATFAACSGPLRVELPAPPENARALVVAVEHDGTIAVEAIALDAPSATIELPYIEVFRGSARVVALYYQQSLEALDLERGKIEPADSGADRGPLPTADDAFAALVHDDRIDPFMPIRSDDLRGLVAGFEIPRVFPHDCFALEKRELDLGTMNVPVALARYDDRHVFVASDKGELFVVGTSSVTRSATAVTGAHPVSAYRAPNGELWLGAQGGIVLRGDLSRGFTQTASLAHGHQHAFIDGPRDASTPFEIFALTIASELDRYDASTGRWETVEDFETEETYSFGALLWLGAHDVLFTPPFTYEIAHYHDGAIDVIEGAFTDGRVRTLGQLHDGRVIAVTETTSVFEVRGPELVRLTGVLTSPSPSAVAAIGQGFVFMSRGGLISLWQPIDGYCPQDQVEIDGAPVRAVSLGDTVFILVSDDNVQDARSVAAKVYVLSRAP